MALQNLAHSVVEMLDTRDDAVLLLPLAITPHGQTRGESDATHAKATAKAVAHERGKSTEIAVVAQQLAASSEKLLHAERAAALDAEQRVASIAVSLEARE